MSDQNGIILSVQKGISDTPDNVRGNYSDGYHSFNELYEFRKLYNAALFNEWAKSHMEQESWKDKGNMLLMPSDKAKYDVHKSVRHFDGEVIFGGNWFIVVAILPTGQISNHYHMDDWDLFNVPIVDKAKYEFDGHTSEDVANRLKSLLTNN